jgi:hypothetical protein
MTKLKLAALEDDKPVRVSFDLPADVHRELIAYAQILEREAGKPLPDPVKLLPHMIRRFMATDRAFAKAKRRGKSGDSS